MPPAARLLDMHVCPMVTVLVPHVGGPILPMCQPNVLIGFLPAARILDKCFCVGPIDLIREAAYNVHIGRRPAARMGDKTVHGGVIVTGMFNVLIGTKTDKASFNPETGAVSPTKPCRTKAAKGGKPFIKA
jgi:uncharacterized Zn-binding protein involved in type VI secretion